MPMRHGELYVTVPLNTYSNDVQTGFELTQGFANTKLQKTIVQGDEIQASA
jgi:hypothetical protein